MTLPALRPAHARPGTTRVRSLARFAAIGCLALALAGCSAEPGPAASTPAGTPSASASQGPSVEPSTPAASPKPTKTAVALPADCQDVYSPAMLQELNGKNPPLNDPGVTMTSTEVVEGLEVLDSGAATLRCSWGVPSDFGLATNITITTPAQVMVLVDAMRNHGFSCAEAGKQTRCERTETFTDPAGATGETHVLRGNVWVATHWLNFAPAGYTEDIVAQLFG